MSAAAVPAQRGPSVPVAVGALRDRLTDALLTEPVGCEVVDALVAVVAQELADLAATLPQPPVVDLAEGTPERTRELVAEWECGYLGGRAAAREYLLDRCWELTPAGESAGGAR